METIDHPASGKDPSDKSWFNIYRVGGVFTILALAGIVGDVIFGSITGGDLTALPQTAAARFEQLDQHCLLGLYNLDLLNLIIQVLMIPGYIALFAAHRRTNHGVALLALVIFLFGSVMLVISNAALPMLELSSKYAASASDAQKILYAAAGEAMLASGAHGSLGAFPGFILPNIGGLLMAYVMLHGRVFTKISAILGIAGGLMLIVYLVLVTFVPAVKEMATAIAVPGGLLLIAWMVLFTIQLFKINDPPCDVAFEHQLRKKL